MKDSVCRKLPLLMLENDNNFLDGIELEIKHVYELYGISDKRLKLIQNSNNITFL